MALEVEAGLSEVPVGVSSPLVPGGSTDETVPSTRGEGEPLLTRKEGETGTADHEDNDPALNESSMLPEPISQEPMETEGQSIQEGAEPEPESQEEEQETQQHGEEKEEEEEEEFAQKKRKKKTKKKAVGSDEEENNGSQEEEDKPSQEEEEDEDADLDTLEIAEEDEANEDNDAQDKKERKKERKRLKAEKKAAKAARKAERAAKRAARDANKQQKESHNDQGETETSDKEEGNAGSKVDQEPAGEQDAEAEGGQTEEEEEDGEEEQPRARLGRLKRGSDRKQKKSNKATDDALARLIADRKNGARPSWNPEQHNQLLSEEEMAKRKRAHEEEEERERESEQEGQGRKRSKTDSKSRKKSKKDKKKDKKDKKRDKKRRKTGAAAGEGEGEGGEDDERDVEYRSEEDDDEGVESEVTDEGLDEILEEEEEEEEKHSTYASEDEDYTPGGRRSRKRKVSAAAAQPRGRRTSNIKSGSAKMSPLQIDPSLGLPPSYHVFQSQGTTYAFMLNQTDITYGVKGHNKFYFSQVLTDGENYSVLFKWGRVGANKPQQSLKKFVTSAAAVAAFEKKFKDKTKNEWDNKANFVAVKGKYTLVDVLENAMDDDEDTDDDEEGGGGGGGNDVASALPDKVQSLLQRICSRDMLKSAMSELRIDVSKFPLGQLSKQQVSKGYHILTQIHHTLSQGGEDRESTLANLSNQFYTLIPHNFGMSLPPPINTDTRLKEKISLVHTLGDIEVANGLLRRARRRARQAVHPLDASYALLNSELQPLDLHSANYKLVSDMLSSTHGVTHANYTLEVQDIYSVARAEEAATFSPFQQLKRKLLWHGSRTSNIAGILSQGLKIAPPEAPKTGYMFGKGVYFADCASKSANYVRASRDNPYGVLVVAEVATGTEYTLKDAEYMDRPPAPFHCTKGQGEYVPDEKTSFTIEDDVDVPMGPLVQSDEGTTLKYNEYIVYDPAQVKIRYLVLAKFNFSEIDDDF